MARDTSVIFIGNDDYSNNRKNKYLKLFLVNPRELPYRILGSFVPPIAGSKYCKIYVDLLGPSLALLFMAAILHYGHSSKVSYAASQVSPTETLLIYSIVMPILCYAVSRIGKSKNTFLETVSLIGYSLFGHVLTLSVSLLLYQEKSNVFFFVCFLIFGGLSALRIALVFLMSIPLPAARLIVCSLIATLHLLFLIFIHFTYMHKTFIYGIAGNSIAKHKHL